MYEISEDSTILHEPQEHYAVILSSIYIYIFFFPLKNIVITINTFKSYTWNYNDYPIW